MSWARMSFKGQVVYVHVDPTGRPVVDSEGRAEMKYREADTKTYRPAAGNLQRDTGGATAEARPAARKPRAASASKTAVKKGPPGPAALDTQHVWTDGACTGNPGPMGIGVVVLWDKQKKELSEYLGVGTNNIAELTAIDRGLDIAEESAPARDRPVRVYTDSAYSIGVLSMGWKAKANQELVASIRAHLAKFTDVTFVKVAGHAGIPENERCDELARQAVETRSRR
jgi:ribonuclease HI